MEIFSKINTTAVFSLGFYEPWLSSWVLSPYCLSYYKIFQNIAAYRAGIPCFHVPDSKLNYLHFSSVQSAVWWNSLNNPGAWMIPSRVGEPRAPGSTLIFPYFHFGQRQAQAGLETSGYFTTSQYQWGSLLMISNEKDSNFLFWFWSIGTIKTCREHTYLTLPAITSVSVICYVRDIFQDDEQDIFFQSTHKMKPHNIVDDQMQKRILSIRFAPKSNSKHPCSVFQAWNQTK